MHLRRTALIVIAGLATTMTAQVAAAAAPPGSASAADRAFSATSAPVTRMTPDASGPLPAPAAALTQITDFGRNPTGLQMYLYVPKRVAAHPAIVVALHYCTGSGPAMFAGTSYASLADRYGFVVIYPSATRASHCFDVSSPGALTHHGNSDPVGIVSMVGFAERVLGADRNRVYATGISSGAMMTNVLLADYPDVFRAGSAMSGVPDGCFATTDPSGWNAACAQGQIIKTSQQWGDIVRQAFPGYSGRRPAIQLWHGTADAILAYQNFRGEVKQWTNVLHTGAGTVDHPRPTWTHTVYTDGTGRVAVDAYSVAGATHNLAFDEPGVDQLAVQFFGLAVPLTSLRNLASKVGLRFGTAVNTAELAANAKYAQITADQFSTVTPENDMKWQVVEPTRGHYDWSAADRLVAFAQQHGQLVRGHVLLWHNQLPDWLTTGVANGSISNNELRNLLHKHVTDEVTHFKGKIWQWDAANEFFTDNTPSTINYNDFWISHLGVGVIADTFRWAHQADPKALLFYNDYNDEGIGPKSDAIYAFVQQLLAHGVPINGVGLQTHLDVQYPFPDRMQQNMQRFARLGLKLAVTEADVRIPLPVDATKQLAQNADYVQSLQACLAVQACISYTVWGFGDAYSWVPGVFPGEGAADIYDAMLQPKPSYYALQQTLSLAAGAPPRTGIGALVTAKSG